MGKKINKTVTKTALALWTKASPIEELEKIGFKKATEVKLEPEDLCLIIFLEESEIAFGMVMHTDEKHATFTCYEHIASGEVSMHVQIPKSMFLVLKLEKTVD